VNARFDGDAAFVEVPTGGEVVMDVDYYIARVEGHHLCAMNQNSSGRNHFGWTVRAAGRKTTVYIHRDAHGPVPKGWVVHHGDFDSANNRRRNLVAVPLGVHSALHARARKDPLFEQWVKDPANFPSIHDRDCWPLESPHASVQSHHVSAAA